MVVRVRIVRIKRINKHGGEPVARNRATWQLILSYEGW
jgi:hypothetical protein